MAARRGELLRIGGSDEHRDYLGFCCGPYEMTFRLQNRGRRERWLTNEYLYHTWHPNQTSFNSDYQAPHDGRFLPLRALHARATGQVQPYRPNAAVVRDDLTQFLRDVAERPEPDWVVGAQPQEQAPFVYQVDREDRGFRLYVQQGRWYGVPVGQSFATDRWDVLRADDEESLRQQIDAIRGSDRTPPRPSRLERFRRDLLGEPIHQLPRRVWRKVRSRVASQA
jgi:hypothetical protein